MQGNKWYIIAGEASGDLHGSNLIKALKKERKDLVFRFWGGDLMEKYAGKPVKHIKELAFMGFIEVLKNITTIFRNISFCKSDILNFKPDILVLIDYPGFNLRIANWAKNNNIRVFYYISPQVWAWKQKRVYQIIKNVEKMYVILPFEKEFYAKFNYDVEYLGHPLLDAIEEYRETSDTKNRFLKVNNLSLLPIIALLPGSRKQEIKAKLPIMIEAVRKMNNYQIVIAAAPAIDKSFYLSFLTNSNAKIVYSSTYDLLNNAEAALVTSGTATLETALFKVPQIVCYKTSKISYHIAKKLIKINFISLVNLIMEKEVVKELIQDECNPTRINKELESILLGGKKRDIILENYNLLIEKLGNGGASNKIAHSMLKTIFD